MFISFCFLLLGSYVAPWWCLVFDRQRPQRSSILFCRWSGGGGGGGRIRPHNAASRQIFLPFSGDTLQEILASITEAWKLLLSYVVCRKVTVFLWTCSVVYWNNRLVISSCVCMYVLLALYVCVHVSLPIKFWSSQRIVIAKRMGFQGFTMILVTISLVGYDTVLIGNLLPTFRLILLPPSSV
jgi:hypothetical protein